jgi:hypothetical protein
VAAVLLIVLWVRSYSNDDYLEHYNNSTDGVALGSIRGVVYLSHTVEFANGAPPRWEFGSYPVDYNTERPLWFSWGLSPLNLIAPHWLFTGLCTIVAAASWMRSRFSLRTLLIATTLVAVVLRMIILSVRNF